MGAPQRAGTPQASLNGWFVSNNSPRVRRSCVVEMFANVAFESGCLPIGAAQR